MKYPIIYKCKDFKFSIGPIYLDTDTAKLKPINITNLAQLKVSTFTDVRFKSVSVLKTPATGEGLLIKVTDYVYNVVINDVDTAKMKVGYATVIIETDQIDAIYVDGQNNQAGEGLVFEVLDL